MRRILHVITRPELPAVARAIQDWQQRQPGLEVQVVDLAAAEPDYAALLEAVFAADVVETW
ncbi:MAG TPA: hypothetical protein VNO52_06865 [Methylomirabilota bacterium]|nr:hypothetical protein [Methylomirabilota bacterium]